MHLIVSVCEFSGQLRACSIQPGNFHCTTFKSHLLPRPDILLFGDDDVIV